MSKISDLTIYCQLTLGETPRSKFLFQATENNGVNIHVCPLTAVTFSVDTRDDFVDWAFLYDR